MSTSGFIVQEQAATAADAPSTTSTAAAAPSASEISQWASEATNQLIDLAVAYAPRLGLALLVLVIGWIVIGVMRRGINRILTMRSIDPTVGNFLGSVAGIALKVMLLLSVAGMVGVEVTSFIAILSAATLAIGMALKGTLSNFAGGVSVMIFRPYKVGDFIEGGGHTGSVKEIQIFNTVLTTGDNRTIIIPNNAIATGSLVNFSTQSTRRVQIDVGIGYEDDIDKARDIVMNLLVADSRIHTDPEPMVVVGALGASSVDLVIRFWVDADDFWPTTFDYNERIKKAFDVAGVNIPYPQQVVRYVGGPAGESA